MCTICHTVELPVEHVPTKERIHKELVCPDCYTLISRAINAIERARIEGVRKYGPTTWRRANDNIEHATTHVYMHRRGDTTEDHLAHAICRLVMEYARNVT